MNISNQALLLATFLTSVTVHAGICCRRHLLESLAPSQDILQKCAQEEYTIYLGSVEDHLGLMVKPAMQQNDCPALAFHAVRTEEDDLVKVAHMHNDDEDLDKLKLGSFALERIVQAHTVAPAGSLLDKYSFFHNNCGSYLVNMGEELGINPNNPSIVGFVRDQLSMVIMNTLYREEEGIEIIESHYAQTKSDKPKAGAEIVGETEEEKAIVGDFVATYIQEHSHHAATTTTKEDAKYLVEGSGARLPAASMTRVALATLTAAGAFVMMF